MAKQSTQEEKEALVAELNELGVTDVNADMAVKELTERLKEVQKAQAPSTGKKKKDEYAFQATGQFIVRELEPGKFRMYNERGVAVSPVVSGPSKDHTQLNRQASRANALRRNRVIKTPKGHEGV